MNRVYVYLQDDWRKRSYRQKSFLLGLIGIVVFMFIVAPSFLIIYLWNGSFLIGSCSENFFGCYRMGALWAATLGTPISIIIMVLSFMVGWIVENKNKPKE